jgi:hypothetical protein
MRRLTGYVANAMLDLWFVHQLSNLLNAASCGASMLYSINPAFCLN